MAVFNHVLMYDGYCKLCSKAVSFVLRHEDSPKIQFVSLQSDLGKQLLNSHQINVKQIDSVVFIVREKAFVKSRAVMEITLFLKYPYKFLRILKYLPYGWMDFVYDLIAKYRYKIFGKKDACGLVDVTHLDRFIV